MMKEFKFQWLRIFSCSCLIVGLVGGWFQWQASSDLLLTPLATKITQSRRPAEPDRLIIPAAKIDTSLSPAHLTEGNWQISPSHPNYLTDSARPGENSNVVIYGHNTQRIFGHLKQAHLGDTLQLETPTQTITYQITGRYIAWPSETTFIQPTDTETLTIYTCIGLFDSQRLVLQARPVNTYYRTKLACAQ